jgi:hypothetical protein
MCIFYCSKASENTDMNIQRKQNHILYYVTTGQLKPIKIAYMKKNYKHKTKYCMLSANISLPFLSRNKENLYNLSVECKTSQLVSVHDSKHL